MQVGRILQGIVIENGILTHWPIASDLSMLLRALPATVRRLGFERFLFICDGRFYCSSDDAVTLEDRESIQASLERPPFYIPFRDIPAVEHCTVSGIYLPPLTDRYHGWVQPVIHDDSQSGLAILRGAREVSIYEMYEKARVVLWLACELHQAALKQACSSVGA